VVSSARVHTEPRAARPVVLAAVAVGVVLAVAAGLVVGFRLAGYVLAVELAVVAVLRLLLPVRVVGALAVRSRVVDAGIAGVLAVALAVLTWTTPG